MMIYRNIWFIIGAILLCLSVNAQESSGPKQLGKLEDTPYKVLEEVNAYVFRPVGYETVTNPRLPDSLASLMGLSKDALAEMYRKRYRHNPYLVFVTPIELKKDAIFIGFSASWIRLSSYYRFNNDERSAEDFRIMVNKNILGKNMIDYSPRFELLNDVTGYPRELINADTVFIYDSRSKYRFNDTTDNYGSLVVHLVKFDLGYVSLRYFYPLHQRELALSEIDNTWGIVQFKPDSTFQHPSREEWTPKPTEPDLYFGKFSFLNNPDQVAREQEQYRQRKIKGAADGLVWQGIRLLNSGNVGQAKEKFVEALRLDSTNVRAYRNLTWMATEENSHDESWSYLTKLVEIEPESTETWFLKGLVEKRFNELDSAAMTFEMIVAQRDSLHFSSFVELAKIAMLNGDQEAADLYFNRAIAIFTTEGNKSLRKESHRMLDINDLFMVRMTYADLLNTNLAFEKSKILFEQTLDDEARAIEADEKGESRHIYGKLTITNLKELYFMLAQSHIQLKNEASARMYLEDAKRLGKKLPESLEQFLDH